MDLDRRHFLAAGAAAVGGALVRPAAGAAAATSEATLPGAEPVTFPLGPFVKYAGNPILRPDPSHDWESAFLFNPAAIVVGSHVALLYRAQNAAKVSSIGLAFSPDGIHFTRRQARARADRALRVTGGRGSARGPGRPHELHDVHRLRRDERAVRAGDVDRPHQLEQHGVIFPDFRDPLAGGKPWNKSGAILRRRSAAATGCTSATPTTTGRTRGPPELDGRPGRRPDGRARVRLGVEPDRARPAADPSPPTTRS